MPYIGQGSFRETRRKHVRIPGGAVTFSSNFAYYDLGAIDATLKADWRNAMHLWIEEIFDYMRLSDWYKGDGIPEGWRKEVRFNVRSVTASLYNTSPFFKFVEKSTRGGYGRRFPSWKQGSRLWDWAERKGIIGFTAKKQIQAGIVYGIAKKIFEQGTVGKELLQQRIEYMLPALDAMMIDTLNDWINREL